KRARLGTAAAKAARRTPGIDAGCARGFAGRIAQRCADEMRLQHALAPDQEFSVRADETPAFVPERAVEHACKHRRHPCEPRAHACAAVGWTWGWGDGAHGKRSMRAGRARSDILALLGPGARASRPAYSCVCKAMRARGRAVQLGESCGIEVGVFAFCILT